MRVHACAAKNCQMSVLPNLLNTHGWSGEGLKTQGLTSLPIIGVFCIYRFQSISVEFSGDNPSFRIYNRKKMRALLRLFNVVSPFLYTRRLTIELSCETFFHLARSHM